MAQQSSKKGKARRVPKAKILKYWSINHPTNMVRRALRVLKTQGSEHMDRFVSLHSLHCNACKNILQARVKRELPQT